MTAPNPEPGYVCPQCGPDPAGADRHAATHHTWPPAGEDAPSYEPAPIVSVCNWCSGDQGVPLRAHHPGGQVEHVPASATTADDSSDGAARMQRAILDQAATWEVTFSAGPGQVVTVSDAAVVAARVAEAALAARDAELTQLREQHDRELREAFDAGYRYEGRSTGWDHWRAGGEAP